MDPNARPWLPPSLLLLFLLHSLIPLSSSSAPLRRLLQSNPPQNNQTSSPPLPSHSPSSEKGKLAAAVIITAAVSFSISGLIFFAINRLAAKRRKAEPQIYVANPMPPSRPSKIDPNLKGIVVDDNGLDVLCWKSLDDAFPRFCDNCNSLLKQSSDDEDSLTPSENNRRRKRKDSQEIPLLTSDAINSSFIELSADKGPQVALPQPIPPPPPPPPVKSPPPLPPAMPAKKGPAPPPPPAARRNGGPPVPSGFPRPPLAPDGGKDRPRLKPLHWDKVTPANAGQSMVWDKITDGSIGFNDDLLESLFGYTATNRPRQPSATSITGSAPSSNPTPAQIRLLDPRKSQNISIILRTIAVSRQDILDALLDGYGLNHDTLEKLSRIAPNPDEESLILSFSGNHSHLADAESFLFHILHSVPSAFPRVSALHFRSSVYEPEILLLRESLETFDLACKELRTRKLFLKLLEAILKAGNRMNAGTARGNAQAFDLIALRKLSDVKSTDGKTNLLHFVVEEVVRSEGKRCAAMNRSQSIRRLTEHEARQAREEREREYMMLGLPIVGGLSLEFSNVKKAATIDHDALSGSCAVLEVRLTEIRLLVGSWKEEEGGFVREMTEFVEAAAGELERVKEEQGRVMEKVRRTTEYYQPGSSKDKAVQPLQLFVIVRDFLAMVDQACLDITRNLQKKKPVAQAAGEGMGDRSPAAKISVSDSGREERITARFPNLPARFMSDHSVLSSDSEEEDEF